MGSINKFYGPVAGVATEHGSVKMGDVKQSQHTGQYKECEGVWNGGQDGACCKSKGAMCCSHWQSHGHAQAKSPQCPQQMPFLKAWRSDNQSSLLMKRHGRTSLM